MYQVKKQLQDAIKKLKAEWGINGIITCNGTNYVIDRPNNQLIDLNA